MPELKDYALLAKDILSSNTGYKKNKKIINDIFQQSSHLDDKVLFRLSAIDSFYSTQMNKRIFGLAEISNSINTFSEDDLFIKNSVMDYLEDPDDNNQISVLLNSDYGYNKTGSIYGIASSLISKYFYFIAEYKFPIFDSLVQNSYKEISGRYIEFELPNLPTTCNSQYFKALKKLNTISEMNDFDMLDNLLWLYGKIKKGSLSLILNKDMYLSLVKNHIPFGNIVKSKDVDRKICEYIQDKRNADILSHLLGENLFKFICFCFNNELAL